MPALASSSCFRTSIQKIVDEFEASSDNEQIGDMPLAVSLNALLQEEALAHMLSSLRAECSEYYASTHGSLAVVNALSNRILTAERSLIFGELQRWTQSFLGPFNGIVGSILTCKSCSFQKMLKKNITIAFTLLTTKYKGERSPGELHCAPSEVFMLFDVNNDGLISFEE
ncbi:ubiquitin-specific protease 27 [Artemisia annua]|uniref:Ubiquitin-specific protease 27 n=1 Tax=Artemisia annua TaxID=35608 RepID=A0A2U1LAS0_ARTAN|nr:ubiquitin-specific protease 27 [Artemisia annua]